MGFSVPFPLGVPGGTFPTHPWGSPRLGPLGFPPPPEAGDSRETHGWEWQATTHPWLTFPTYLDQVPRAVPLKGWRPIHREKLWGENEKTREDFFGGGWILLKGWFELVKKIFTYISKDFFGKKKIWVFLLQFFWKWLFELKKYTLTEFSIQLVSILEERRPSLTSCTLQLQQLFHHRNINRRLTSCLISTLLLYNHVNPDIFNLLLI